jgi:hypothetical protein
VLQQPRRHKVPDVGARRPSERELLTTDALWSVGVGFATANAILSGPFLLRHLELARTSGNASQMCRSLSLEAVTLAFLKGGLFEKQGERAAALARALAEQTGDDYDQAWVLTADAIRQWPRGNFQDVVDRGRVALDAWSRCAGVHWEVGNLQVYLFNAMAQLGQLNTLREAVEACRADADDRADYMGLMVSGLGLTSVVYLADGRPEFFDAFRGSKPGVDEQTTSWPETRFRSGHYAELIAEVHCDLYNGRALEAWVSLDAFWPLIEGDFILGLNMAELEVRHLRARVALAAVAAMDEGRDRPPGWDDRWTRDALLRTCDEDARAMRKGLPAGSAWASLVDAGSALARSDAETAEAAMLGALSQLEALGLDLYVAAARWAWSHHAGGNAERYLAEACAFFSEQGGVDPPRWCSALVPGVAPPVSRID